MAEIMVTLFNQEKVMEIHDYHIALEAREDGLKEGRAEGRAEGLMEGRMEEKREMVHNMKSLNIPLDTISQVTGLSIEEIKSL